MAERMGIVREGRGKESSPIGSRYQKTGEDTADLEDSNKSCYQFQSPFTLTHSTLQVVSDVLWLHLSIILHCCVSLHTRWGNWLFFNLPNHSSRTIALGFTHPLTEKSTRNLPGRGGGGGKTLPARRTDSHTATCVPIVQKMWDLRHLRTPWTSTACDRDRSTFYANITIVS
jgi:hypothetical protein